MEARPAPAFKRKSSPALLAAPFTLLEIASGIFDSGFESDDGVSSDFLSIVVVPGELLYILTLLLLFVLVDSDGLSITFAEGCKQVKESFVFELTDTKTYQACNCGFFDLGVKKLLVVFEQFCYRFLSKETVRFIRYHSLFEK